MSVRAKSIRLKAQATKGRLRLVGNWGDKPLDDLRVACAASGAVDKLIRQTVEDARRHGYSWAEIGRALGISKQSAWERFSGEE
ncbi:MAG TPA: AsnC family protein [Actinomycetota bacterium]|jgi:hypothetical protein|nr:AsnC family protein [Actinomycetota bacterium]